MIQPDELFSYWILAWYIVYSIGYTQYNPKIAFFVATLVNLFVLFAMVYFKVHFKHILYFILVTILFKLFPLWTLRNIPIVKKDIQATFALLLMYIGWILWKDKEFALYQGYIDLLEDKQSMPGMTLLEYLHI